MSSAGLHRPLMPRPRAGRRVERAQELGEAGAIRMCGRSSHLLPVGAGQEPALPSATLFSDARLRGVSPACLLPSPKRSSGLWAEQPKAAKSRMPPVSLTWSPTSAGLGRGCAGRAGTEDSAVISLQMLFA